MTPPSNSSLSEKARANVAAILNHALTEELLLSTATRSVYARFPAFHRLHKLFADQYRQLETWLERLARCAAAPVPPIAEVPVGHSRGADSTSENTVIADLLSLHEELANELQEDMRKCAYQFGDPAAADVLKRLIEFHETTAWMLRTVMEGSASTPAKRR